MPIISGQSGGSGAISGVTVSGTAAAGQVPVATTAIAGSWKYPPGFEINYTQATASVTVASTTEATGTTILSPGAIVFDGTPVLLHFFCMRVNTNTVLGNGVTLSLFEGATQITRLGLMVTVAAQTQLAPWSLFYRFTPTAASHTYTLTAFSTNANDAQFECGSGGTGAQSPMFVRFTKV